MQRPLIGESPLGAGKFSGRGGGAHGNGCLGAAQSPKKVHSNMPLVPCMTDPWLVRLRLQSSGHERAMAAIAGSAAPFLVRLKLDGCAVSDVSAGLLGEACKRLEELSLVGCRSLGDDGLVALAGGCCKVWQSGGRDASLTSPGGAVSSKTLVHPAAWG